MAERSAIEWCDSTLNPWFVCTKVSPACDHCYAEAMMDKRLGRAKWGAGQPRQRTSAANWRQPLKWNAQAEYFGQCDVCGHRGEKQFMRAADGRKVRTAVCQSCNNGLMQPARRRVFCASLADWLDNEVPVEWLADLLSLIHATPNLDWLLLTKRIGNWKARMNCALGSSPLPERWLNGQAPANVWLGATICNQPEADRDIPKLLAVPARVRFLSIEPMLGPVDLLANNDVLCRCEGCLNMARQNPHDAGLQRIDWVICGGESGQKARPTHPDWPRLLRDQCAAAGVPFLLKQWGEWIPADQQHGGPRFMSREAQIKHERSGRFCVANGMPFWKIGKRAAGRLLDGVEHNGFPVVTP